MSMLLEFDPNFYPALLTLCGFSLMLLLGAVLLRLIEWETRLLENRALWLHRLRTQGRQIRVLRRQLEQWGNRSFGVPMTPAQRRNWQVFRWVARAMGGRHTAHS